MVLISLIVVPIFIIVAAIYFGRLAMIMFGDTEDDSDSHIFYKTKNRRRLYLIVFPIMAILAGFLAAAEEYLRN